MLLEFRRLLVQCRIALRKENIVVCVAHQSYSSVGGRWCGGRRVSRGCRTDKWHLQQQRLPLSG